MKLNCDFSTRVVIERKHWEWVPSPAPGVERVMLDRIGDEVARATSVVRYAPHTTFPTHTHDGGEEIFVIDGTFSDEFGSYPKGSYLRNPIGTSHAPKVGEEGATIFVKLHQFDTADPESKVIQTTDATFRPGLVPGLSVLPLHQFENESCALVRWAPNTLFSKHKHWGGEEIFVLEGTFYDEHGIYPMGTWIRSPHLSAHTPFTKEDGALIYVKTGHL